MKKFVTKDGNLRYQTIKHLLTITNELWRKVNQIAEECGIPNAEFKKEEWNKEVKKVYSVTDITTIVSKKFNVKKIDGKSRKREVSDARIASYFLLRNFTNLSYKSIGELLGNKDHTTVLSGIKSYKNLYQTDERFKSIMDNILSTLNIERKNAKNNDNGTIIHK